METKEFNIDEEFNESVQAAQKIFFEGGVFVYPTDTIYGFGANPFNKEAIYRITRIKQRDESKGYILLANDMNMIMRYVDLRKDSEIDFLMSIWPNPVTVILPLKKEHAGLLQKQTVAFRIPNHTFCLKLISQVNMPLVSTSVNRSGEVPINDATMVRQEFKDELDAIFYSVKLQYNLTSTVINLAGNTLELIREGRVPFDEIYNKYRKLVG
ncbi:MAG: threonylcarbamoyl-AMP synthase [Ignavibacteria bacterium]|nr:threonylcarbamoyl-AMP synthase [Ignavibacteria bacterium]